MVIHYVMCIFLVVLKEFCTVCFDHIHPFPQLLLDLCSLDCHPTLCFLKKKIVCFMLTLES